MRLEPGCDRMKPEKEAIGVAEEKTLAAEKPKSIWNGALKMVKGENTNQLIEQFTAEMTLVAEGLCEDQSKLRKEVDGLMTQEDGRIQKLAGKVELLENTLEEERTAHDKDVTELRNRLAVLEKKAAKAPAKEKRNLIRDLTILVGIAAGAWIIVTILNMIKV